MLHLETWFNLFYNPMLVMSCYNIIYWFIRLKTLKSWDYCFSTLIFKPAWFIMRILYSSGVKWETTTERHGVITLKAKFILKLLFGSGFVLSQWTMIVDGSSFFFFFNLVNGWYSTWDILVFCFIFRCLWLLEIQNSGGTIALRAKLVNYQCAVFPNWICGVFAVSHAECFSIRSVYGHVFMMHQHQVGFSLWPQTWVGFHPSPAEMQCLT